MCMLSDERHSHFWWYTIFPVLKKEGFLLASPGRREAHLLEGSIVSLCCHFLRAGKELYMSNNSPLPFPALSALQASVTYLRSCSNLFETRQKRWHFRISFIECVKQIAWKKNLKNSGRCTAWLQWPRWEWMWVGDNSHGHAVLPCNVLSSVSIKACAIQDRNQWVSINDNFDRSDILCFLLVLLCFFPMITHAFLDNLPPHVSLLLLKFVSAFCFLCHLCISFAVIIFSFQIKVRSN